MADTYKLTFGLPDPIVIDNLPLSNWTIVNTNTLSINGDTITQLGIGGWYESMFVSFTVPETGSYKISYDYNITNAKVGSHGTYGFGLWLTTNNPNVSGPDQDSFYNDTTNRTGFIIGVQNEDISGKHGKATFNVNLVAGTTYYLWYPGAALDDGTTYTLTFTNIRVYNNPIQYTYNNILTYPNWDGFVGYTEPTHPVIEWDTWDRTTYDDTSWQSTLTKSGTVGTVTISKASQFINFGATASDFYTNNSLSTLNVELTKHFRFNDTSSLTTATNVYNTLSSNGVRTRTNKLGYFVMGSNKKIVINGNGHVIQGLYCYFYGDGRNNGAFIQLSGTNSIFTINNLTFDRCLFRSNTEASCSFSMITGGAKFISNYLNFNKCAIANESTASYQCIMFGFLNDNSSTEYNHTQISFYCCGFKGARSWSDYSCGCGGISNWSSTPKFKAIWNNATYINPIKLGGSGTMKLYAGNRATTTYNGTCSYYNVGSGITAQGTGKDSAAECITTFNNTVSNQDYILVLDANDNLYHKVEI